MTDLKSRFEALKQERGRLPTRDGAKELGVSEAALVSALCGDTITRLDGAFAALLKRVPDFGRIMGLVRNDNFVAMPIGDFSELIIDGTKGHAKGGNIDFTFDLARWASVFALKEMSHGTLRRMLQFFDDGGAAVLKIVLWSDDGNDAFDAVVEEFKVAADTPLKDDNTDPGWQAFDPAQNARLVTGNAPERVQNFLQACIDGGVEIELWIPTHASAETYRGPLRKLEPRETEGWIDLRYPHFTTHFGVGAVAKAAVDTESAGGIRAVTLADDEGLAICRISCAEDGAAARDAWSTAAASTLLG